MSGYRGNKRKKSGDSSGDDDDKSESRRRDARLQLEVRPARPSRKLNYEDYTVGWICALPLEMTAARAMLDEEHDPLPNLPGDHNNYILGSICDHNIVVCCLPLGVYGTTSATAAGVSMCSTYPNSKRMPLMVGIGGGVPSKNHDIRLGDVVVGVPTSETPAVKQYDYGKTMKNGRSEPKGNLNKPAPKLLSAVSKLKTEHDLRQDRRVEYISKALRKYSLQDFRYPGGALDILFTAECEHVLEDTLCSSCGPPKQVLRPPRLHNDSIVHYGTIGSGNQVIKHARTRDSIAQRLSIICFEMEAAGLMDYLPCLVIRGISDYCDSQKTKLFQGYAALAAAAYAKELLSVAQLESLSTQEARSVDLAEVQTKQDHRKMIMQALDFYEAENRRETVKKASLYTCNWLLGQQEYVDWLNKTKASEHHGLLWIRGKPGTGKSTLIKFALEEEEKLNKKDFITVSFFFNARGSDLEKSTIGMYRSLVHQLLKKVPSMQVFLDDLSPAITFDKDRLEVAKSLFRRCVMSLAHRQLLCFVDALDECPEEQIRDMVDFFEKLGEQAFLKKIYPRILFSSRHYPNISIQRGQVLVLESQDGHSRDIIKYINAELNIGKNKQAQRIKEEISERSRGIFLWVVLVVQMLKREYDKGRVHGLMKRLQAFPTELNELFEDILLRDKQQLPEFVLCMQLALYAIRPLSREEFYFALLSGDVSLEIEKWDRTIVTHSIMENMILDYSKGLVELTRTSQPTVHFIHETVREFLLTPGALANVWPGFGNITAGPSHQQIRDCCARYLRLEIISEKSWDLHQLHRALELYPFLAYAVWHVLEHSNTAERYQLCQSSFSVDFPWWRWRTLSDDLQMLQGLNQHLMLFNAEFITKLNQYFSQEFTPKERQQGKVHIANTHPHRKTRKV